MKQREQIDNLRLSLVQAIREAVEKENGCIGMFYKNTGQRHRIAQTEEEYDATPIVAAVHDPRISAYGSIEAATVYDVYLDSSNKLFCTLNGESGEDFEEPIEYLAVESLLNITGWLVEHNFYEPGSQITDKFWDFVEKYCPGYHEREDVLRQAQLQLYIDGHESPVSGEMSKDEAGDELHHILYNLYHKAIEAYTQGQGAGCEHCNEHHTKYCPACGKRTGNDKIENPYRCTRCGSINIQRRAWVYPNQDDRIVDYCSNDDEEDDNWCDNCEEHVSLSTEDDLLREINEWWDSLGIYSKEKISGLWLLDYEATKEGNEEFLEDAGKVWNGLTTDEKIEKWKTYKEEEE